MWLYYSCCSISPSLFHTFSYSRCTPFSFFHFLLLHSLPLHSLSLPNSFLLCSFLYPSFHPTLPFPPFFPLILPSHSPPHSLSYIPFFSPSVLPPSLPSSSSPPISVYNNRGHGQDTGIFRDQHYK